VKKARKILDRNWTGAHTMPSSTLYPHQWNWDSAFVSIGYAGYDQRRAQKEILSLFGHQWENGMIPHIAFDEGSLGNYFPEPDFWTVPGGALTSGITQPPLHATACLHIYQMAKKRVQALDFLKIMWPKLVASHGYFYRYRNFDGSGLVYIRHPWESGIDNSPAWDGPLEGIEVDRTKLPPYERKDLARGVPAEERPGDDDYDRYVYLVDLFRRLGYREEAIYRECPFLIKDVMFNSILCRANKDLIEIGRIIKEDTREIEEWEGVTEKAITESLWCEECRKFDSIDIVTGERLHTATAASFMPLFAGAATRAQAEIMYKDIDSISFCALHQGNCFTIPNYDMTRDDFDSRNYWRGPVWININWMLSRGLKSYGYNVKADAMKRDMIQLPIRFGFHEYFDSRTGQGYGSPDFSWTAALFLDLVREYYDRVSPGLGRPSRGKVKLGRKRVLNHGNSAKSGDARDISSDLMRSIGHLKERFLDPDRGRINYEAMKRSAEYEEYRKVAAGLKKFDPATLSTPQEKKAFWINLYNTIVVQGIVELGIGESVKEIRGFFKNIAYNVGGFLFSADDMEHGILRANKRPPYAIFPLFRGNDPRRPLSLDKVDPRIHFALVCGSRSCAPIRFYQPDLVEEQLEQAARSFVNSSEVIIVPEENKVFLSQIFEWYSADFGGRRKALDFILMYLDPDEKASFLKENMNGIRMEYLFYDWNLNH